MGSGCRARGRMAGMNSHGSPLWTLSKVYHNTTKNPVSYGALY